MFLHEIPENLVVDFLNLAYTMMGADGVIAEEELSVFNMYSVETKMNVMASVKVVDYDETLIAFSKLEKSLKMKIYFELFSLSYADGDCSEEEQKLLEKVVKVFGLSNEEVVSLQTVTVKLLYDYELLGEIING